MLHTRKLMIALLITLLPACAQNSGQVDTAMIKDGIDQFARMALKNATAVNGKIIYSMTSKEFCVDFLGQSEEDAANDQAYCDTMANNLRFEQTIYNTDGTDGSIKIMFSGNQVIKYSYSPTAVSFNVDFSELTSAGTSLATILGADPAEVTAIFPSSGAIKLSLNNAVQESSVKVEVLSAIDKSWSDVHLALGANDFVEFITKLNTRDVTLKTNLSGALFGAPNNAFPGVFPNANSSDPVVFNTGDLAGEFSANKDSKIITIKDFNLANLALSLNSAAALSVALPNAITASYDYNNVAFTGTSAVDLTLDVAQEAFGGMLLVGTNQFKYDASATLSADPSNYALASNIKNLKLKTVSDQLNSLLGLTLPASKPVELDVAEFSGGVSYANSVLTMDTLKLNGINAKFDSATEFSTAQTGSFHGTVDLSTYAVSLADAQDFQASVVDSLALLPSSYNGDYEFGYGVNTSFNLVQASGGITSSVNLKDFIAKAPSDLLASFGINQFAAGVPVTLSADEISGTYMMSASGDDSSQSVNALKLKNIGLYEDASLAISLNQASGDYTGSFTTNSNTNISTAALSASDLRLVVNNNFGIPNFEAGSYKLANGLISGQLQPFGAGMQVDYSLAGLSVIAPYAGSIAEIAVTAPTSGTYKSQDKGAVSNELFNGTLGSGYIHYGSGAGSDLVTWAMSAPTTVTLGTATSPTGVIFDRATILNISHDNAAALTSLGLDSVTPGGVGSVALTLGAATEVNFPTVTTGSLQANFTGNPYAALFGAGGFLEGMDTGISCDVANVTGVCSVTVH